MQTHPLFQPKKFLFINVVGHYMVFCFFCMQSHCTCSTQLVMLACYTWLQSCIDNNVPSTTYRNGGQTHFVDTDGETIFHVAARSQNLRYV